MEIEEYDKYIDTMLDIIYEKYKNYFMNEGEIPNLITLSPKMCSVVINYFQLPELTTVLGMNIVVSSEVDSFDKIGVYRIERPDEWKDII